MSSSDPLPDPSSPETPRIEQPIPPSSVSINPSRDPNPSPANPASITNNEIPEEDRNDPELQIFIEKDYDAHYLQIIDLPVNFDGYALSGFYSEALEPGEVVNDKCQQIGEHTYQIVLTSLDAFERAYLIPPPIGKIRDRNAYNLKKEFEGIVYRAHIAILRREAPDKQVIIDTLEAKGYTILPSRIFVNQQDISIGLYCSNLDQWLDLLRHRFVAQIPPLQCIGSRFATSDPKIMKIIVKGAPEKTSPYSVWKALHDGHKITSLLTLVPIVRKRQGICSSLLIGFIQGSQEDRNNLLGRIFHVNQRDGGNPLKLQFILPKSN